MLCKLKEQNGNRLTDSKNELVVTKGRGVGDHGENSVAQKRHIVDLWQLAALMDSDCIGIWVGT